MYYLGIDIGSLTGKAVVLDDSEIVGETVIRVKKRPKLTVDKLMENINSITGLQFSDISYCLGTGYGRRKIPLANETISEITCHGTGAHFLCPTLRTVIDIGGQDCKVIRIDEHGHLKNFIMNEKCAAGTGRYLELMAETLKLKLEELGPVSLKSKTPVSLTSQCSIFAQAEVIQFISEGFKTRDIAAGVNKAMAERVVDLAEKVGVEEDVAVSGGVAKNVGVVRNLEEILQVGFKKMPRDPQIIGALGAALIAKKSFKK
ncbi:MAG: acyl-CoA dehydratase activase [Candidatus Helarchaeota archaeon]